MISENGTGGLLFVGYAREPISVTSPATGSVSELGLFVAVFEASRFAYAEACSSQGIDNWIAAHIRAFRFFDGVPAMIIPCYSERKKRHLWRYQKMILHYEATITNVLREKIYSSQWMSVESWLLTVLRQRRYLSIAAMNAAILELLHQLNSTSLTKGGMSRRKSFLTVDRPALLALPKMDFEDATWLRQRVKDNYHVSICGHEYSVPHLLAQEEVDIKVTPNAVQIFFQGKRVSQHKRDDRPNRSSTKRQHLPAGTSKFQQWSNERLLRWADTVGPATTYLVDSALKHQGKVRVCLALLALQQEFGAARLESCCRHAISSGSWSVSSVRSLLRERLDERLIQLSIPGLYQARPTQCLLNRASTDDCL